MNARRTQFTNAAIVISLVFAGFASACTTLAGLGIWVWTGGQGFGEITLIEKAGAWAILLAFPLFLLLVFKLRRLLRAVSLLLAFAAFAAAFYAKAGPPGKHHENLITLSVQTLCTPLVLMPVSTFVLVTLSGLIEQWRNWNRHSARTLIIE